MDYKDGALSKKKEGGGEKKSEHKSEGGSKKRPHVYVHPHDAGATMHVMHEDGSHEMHHFADGDGAAMGDMLAQHMAGGAGGGAAESAAEGGGAPAAETAEAA